MPWTIDDVEKHKAGLSDKAKKQWVRIASSVLAREKKKGKTEKEAAASAIKQANGVVGNNMGTEKYSVYKKKQDSDYDVEIKIHQQRPYLVVPVTMIVEGVMNGSRGPLLHKKEEFGKFPASWNGIPVVIDHPEEEGVSVSANDPMIIDNQAVGRVYHAEVDGNKLKAELWIDEEKLNAVNENIYTDINDNKMLEVSVGVFSEEDEEEGEYDGVKYEAIAKNHHPDHLAILTQWKGACSCEDGCGIRANKENDMEKEITGIIKATDLRIAIQRYAKEGFRLSSIGNNSEAGYREKMEAVQTALRKEDEKDTYSYLIDMTDSDMIYEKSSSDGTKMYKQSYKFESGKIELVGEPIEVHRKVEYVVNSGLTRTKFSINNKKDGEMAKNECPKCLEKINAVIANKESGFVETDREWLETLSEAALDKTLTPKVKEVEKVVERTIEVNKLTDAQKAALAFGEKQLAERRKSWITGIQANTEKVWTDERLNKMDDDTLEGIFKSVKKEEVGNYSLNGGGSINTNAGEIEGLYPSFVEEPKK